MNISRGLRTNVIRRAGNRCEYCRLSQTGQEAAFHIDHIQPVVEGGKTELENLALACVSCSLRKAARFRALDPLTGAEVAIFHPRRQIWNDHFAWNGERVRGLTPTGRATTELLKMNRLLVVEIRREERVRGRHPPKV